MKGAPLYLVILTANTVHSRSDVGVVVGAKINTDQSFFDSPFYGLGVPNPRNPPFFFLNKEPQLP